MFWGPRTPATSFYLHSLCGAAVFGWHQRHLLPSVCQSLIEFRLLTSACDAWQWSSMKNLGRVDKNAGPILSRLWTKVHKIWGQYRGALVLSSDLDWLSLSRFIQKTFAKKSLMFLAPTFWEWRSRLLYGRLLALFAVHRLAKLVESLLLISVCEAWQWSRMQNLPRVGRNSGPILTRSWWTKVHDILSRCRRRLVVSNALARLCLSSSCFIPKI